MKRQIRLIDDFSEPSFQAAFQTYFNELANQQSVCVENLAESEVAGR